MNLIYIFKDCGAWRFLPHRVGISRKIREPLFPKGNESNRTFKIELHAACEDCDSRRVLNC
jgi:hypothetical protein